MIKRNWFVLLVSSVFFGIAIHFAVKNTALIQKIPNGPVACIVVDKFIDDWGKSGIKHRLEVRLPDYNRTTVITVRSSAYERTQIGEKGEFYLDARDVFGSDPYSNLFLITLLTAVWGLIVAVFLWRSEDGR